MGRKSKKKRNKKRGAGHNATPPAGPPPKPAQPVRSPKLTSDLKNRIGRLASIGLGIMFVLAGTLKVGDPWSFLGSLPAYGIPPVLRLPVTVLMPTIEVVLGVMLLAGWRTRLASTAAVGVLASFAGVIAWGWAAGTLQECGCFGPLLKRTPPQALAQDAVFIAMAVFGMMWAPTTKLEFTRFRVGTLATVVVASMAMIGSSLWADTLTLEERILAAEPTVGTAMPSLEDLDLPNRDVFLYLFHPDCIHCVRNGARMAEIAADPGLPEVIGITHSVNPGEVRAYLDHAGADIKAYEFSLPSFVQITGSAATPQFVYLRRGRKARTWLGDLPSTAELRRAVNAASDEN